MFSLSYHFAVCLCVCVPQQGWLKAEAATQNTGIPHSSVAEQQQRSGNEQTHFMCYNLRYVLIHFLPIRVSLIIRVKSVRSYSF